MLRPRDMLLNYIWPKRGNRETRLLILLAALLFWAFFIHTDDPEVLGAASQAPVKTYRIPRKIWQTWKVPPLDLKDDLLWLSKTWTAMNPSYRYESLTDDSALTYVRSRFAARRDVINTFEQADHVTRADLMRYLTLLGDGGTYADIDVECYRLMDSWFSEELLSKVTMVVGVEYDSRGGALSHGYTIPVQLCEWTLMAAPNHPIISHVVDRIVGKIKTDTSMLSKIPTHDVQYMKETTGAKMFTEAVLQKLTQLEGKPITYRDITNLTSPRIFGDVLVLPVNAFASGTAHSGSKPLGNDEQLVTHRFLNFQQWDADHFRGEHGGQAPPEGQEEGPPGGETKW
ncbi:glycosyltransferase family 32 protein [Teratosphaeria destructans]|uniref:Glycosyltransferase family 32 protein n=1 Tax=Teratosphaeria destructans TaxID=418781 RepID=A0A9W7SUZ1_9PEZI|nr:glycosyltransferase family 32 protein [Teratosphaeria destructans]